MLKIQKYKDLLLWISTQISIEVVKRFIGLLCFIFSTLVYAQKPEVDILITTFSPFGSSKANWSQDIALRVKDLLIAEEQDTPLNISICNLSVSYQNSFNQAKDCFNQLSHSPKLVISLGEAACDLRLETAALNFISSSTQDEDGLSRQGEKIDRMGSDKVPFNSLVQKMYCSLDSNHRSQVLVSASPGGYVCNQLAYQFGDFLIKKNVPYSFIHVPNNNCAQKLIEQSAQSISKMVSLTLPFTDEKHEESSLICEKLPTEISQIKKFRKIMKSYKSDIDKKCQNEFLYKLKAKLKEWKPQNSTY